MTSPTLQMEYHCPLKNSTLRNTDQGKFCDQCAKHIPDMRKKQEQDILEEIKQGKGEFCGTFDPLVMQNPFGDHRDKIVHWYQKLTSVKRSRFSLVVLAGLILLSITGCRRYTRGVPNYSVGGMPVLRVHPRSLIQYTDASNFVKHNVYKIHLTVKKEKKKKRIQPTDKN
jgi:hypothetical protein